MNRSVKHGSKKFASEKVLCKKSGVEFHMVGECLEMLPFQTNNLSIDQPLLVTLSLHIVFPT